MNLSNKLVNSSSEEYMPYEKRYETYIVPILFFFIFIVGTIGNGTLVFVFLRHKEMRSIPNTYVFSLALADLLVIIICVPFTSVYYVMDYWPWSEAVCKLSEYTKEVSLGVSIFTLTALSSERYSIIVDPLRRLQVKPLTVLKAIIIWLLAIILALPSAIFATIKDGPIAINNNELTDNAHTIPYCSPFPDIENFDKYSVMSKSLVYYVIPLITISTFYILMALKLHTSTKRIVTEITGAQGAAQAKSRKHIARMVLIFICLFFICFLPYHVFILWYVLSPSEEEYNDWWHAVRILGFCLTFLHSCVNPVALYFISAAFKCYFKKYLLCRDSPLPSGRTPGTSRCSVLQSNPS